MATGDRVKVTLECTEEPGTSRYYTTKNRKNDSDRLEMKKYNPVLQKHTLHRETK
jgi:large subunit ribosomal protein L33